jgi:hypothetical protein
LVAWRDTVLAPVVAELSATRKELGDARQALGRLEVERDALWSRVEQLEAEQDAAIGANQAPGRAESAKMAADASPGNRSFWRWLKAWWTQT